MPADAEMTKFLQGVVGVVEANTYEQHMLWHENRCHGQPKTWVSNTFGLRAVIGDLADMPVCISLLTAEVEDHKLLFVYATSQVVDYRMVDKWLEDTLPKSAFREDGRVNRVDAMNFHNVFRAR